MAMNIEDRMMDLEVRIARQDDTVDALNRLVYEQQKKIDELESLCSALARRIKEMAEAAADAADVAPADEKPPHY